MNVCGTRLAMAIKPPHSQNANDSFLMISFYAFTHFLQRSI